MNFEPSFSVQAAFQNQNHASARLGEPHPESFSSNDALAADDLQLDAYSQAVTGAVQQISPSVVNIEVHATGAEGRGVGIRVYPRRFDYY